jgi:hypothetical protein
MLFAGPGNRYFNQPAELFGKPVKLYSTGQNTALVCILAILVKGEQT